MTLQDDDSNGCSTLQVDPFATVNTMLLERGCLAKPLDVSELSSGASKSLADLLLSLLDQRQEQASFREQLASRLTVTDSSLERTKRFWKEEQDKSADLARKLDTTKARVGTIAKELSDCQSNLKRTKEELQKSKRDLLTVKQQAQQQKQANERQLERLRARFSDESIKLLRAKVPEVHFESERLSLSSSARRSGSLATSLERKQIEELESRRRELLDSNAALKRFATESLNLARESAIYMGTARMESEELLNSSSNSTSSNATIRPSVRLAQYYQRDLFPALFPLQPDYSETPARGQKQHPAVESLTALNAIVHQRGNNLIQTASKRFLMDRDARRQLPTRTEDEEAIDQCGNGTVVIEATSSTQDDIERRHAEEQTRLLNRALQRVQDLEEEVKKNQRDAVMAQNRREDREERIKQTAEVEKQRQRYLSLCKELEKQEELLRSERDTLQQQQESVLQMEMSLSVQVEDSLASFNESEVMSAAAAPLKRHRENEQETVSEESIGKVKRPRPDQSTPMAADTMRFVTIRKRRGRLQ